MITLKRPFFISGLLLVSIMLACAGCPNKAQEQLRIGACPWPGFEPFFLAREKGYYDKMPIKFVEYTSTSEVIRAFRNGVIDSALLTFDEAILLAETGLDVKAILVIDNSHGGDVILSNPDIKSLEDLKGKKIGVETTALGAYVLTRALQRTNLSVSDLKVVSLEVSEHLTEFEKGHIDAVVTFDPVKTQLLKKGANKLFDSSQIPGEIVDVFIINSDFIKKDKGQINAVLKGWFQALAYLNDHQAEAAQIMAKRENISTKEFLAALSNVRIVGITENREMLTGAAPRLKQTAEQLMQIMLDNHLIKKKVDVEALFDGSYLPRI